MFHILVNTSNTFVDTLALLNLILTCISGNWKGYVGSPKLTWAEGIRGLMAEKGLVEEDWNNRDEWRKKIL